jgi:hypothetical protein
MGYAADGAGGDGLSAPERDAMVAALLGITTERLRTMRRVQVKREQAAGSEPPGSRRAARWRWVDELDDEALFAEVRRREVRARAGGQRRPRTSRS